MADFKEGPRVKASREQWKKLQAEKQGPCRVCGASAYTGYTSLHHLVPRSQGGDDVASNLVPLCGSGTTGCHGKIEARDRTAGRKLRVNLSNPEFWYVIDKKGWDWMDSRYPPYAGLTEAGGLPSSTEESGRDSGRYLGPAIPVSVSFGTGLGDEATTTLDQGSVKSGEYSQEESAAKSSMVAEPAASSPSPGHDCPTCHRRIPHPKKDTTPTNRPFSFRIPEEERDAFREVLEAASRHIGNHDKPFWQWNTVNAGLVLLLQGSKDLLR